MHIFKLLSICLFLIATFPITVPAQEDLALNGGDRWLVLASRKFAADAVQLAEEFQENLQATDFEDKVRVVRSQNGWFGVIVGPAAFKSIRLAQQQFPFPLPNDAYLSRGRRYVEIVWPFEDMFFGEFDKQPRYTFELEDLEINAELISKQTDPNDAYSTVSKVRVNGWVNGSEVFSFDTTADFYPKYGQSVELIRLANETEFPQVVIKRFTGGAHCCVEQQIITQSRNGDWHMIDGPVLDGSGGYHFDDLDGDGSKELVSSDNRFLYLFAPYAGSFAPLYIEKLYFNEILEVNDDPAYLPAFQNELAYLEGEAAANSSLWQENGFLAAWAAVRARLGEGMQAVVDASEKSRGDDDLLFQKSVCPDGATNSNCIQDETIALSFPLGLTVHLIETGYLPVEKLRD